MSLFLELIWAYLCILIIREDILILGEGLTQGSDDTTLTAEVKYPIKFTQSEKRFILALIRLGFLRLVFSGGWGGQFDSPFIFQEELI